MEDIRQIVQIVDEYTFFDPGAAFRSPFSSAQSPTHYDCQGGISTNTDADSVEGIVRAVSSVLEPEYVWVTPDLAQKLNGQDRPIVSAYPGTEDDVIAILRLAKEFNWKLTVVGAGTQLSFGNAPEFVDVALHMERFGAIVEHSQADMVVSVQAGVKFAKLQEFLARYGQILAVDPALHPDATIGGLVATGVNGPMRALYGTLRDMLIATRAVTGEAQVIRTGSKVAKNVAGYDVSKLLIGSLGTLSVLTECTFKLKPLPSHRELCILSGSIEQIDRVRAAVMDSVLIPSALELVTTAQLEFFAARDHLHGPWTILISCDENAVSAEFQTNSLQRLAVQEELSFQVICGEDVQGFWADYRGDLLSAALVERVQCRSHQICELAARIHDVANSLGLSAKVSFSLSAGVGRIFVGPSTSRDGSEPGPFDEQTLAKDIARIAAECGAACVIERASIEIRRHHDAFHSARLTDPERLLMRGVKDAFDPDHLLASGRFGGEV